MVPLIWTRILIFALGDCTGLLISPSTVTSFEVPRTAFLTPQRQSSPLGLFCGDVRAQLPPLRDQSAALVGRHVVFLDRARDSGLFIGRLVDDADQLPRACL